jgi:hypothetical protein
MLAFSADLRWKIETFAFFKELATFCKMSAHYEPARVGEILLDFTNVYRYNGHVPYN